MKILRANLRFQRGASGPPCRPGREQIPLFKLDPTETWRAQISSLAQVP